jgi:hypothetical protein
MGTHEGHAPINDQDINVTLTDDNVADLCTCDHDRGSHWNGSINCGWCSCDTFAYDHLRNAS